MKTGLLAVLAALSMIVIGFAPVAAQESTSPESDGTDAETTQGKPEPKHREGREPTDAKDRDGLDPEKRGPKEKAGEGRLLGNVLGVRFDMGDASVRADVQCDGHEKAQRYAKHVRHQMRAIEHRVTVLELREVRISSAMDNIVVGEPINENQTKKLESIIERAEAALEGNISDERAEYLEQIIARAEAALESGVWTEEDLEVFQTKLDRIQKLQNRQLSEYRELKERLENLRERYNNWKEDCQSRAGAELGLLKLRLKGHSAHGSADGFDEDGEYDGPDADAGTDDAGDADAGDADAGDADAGTDTDVDETDADTDGADTDAASG